MVRLDRFSRQVQRRHAQGGQVGRILLVGGEVFEVAESLGSLLPLQRQPGKLDVGIEVSLVQAHHPKVELTRALLVARPQQVVGVVVPHVGRVGGAGRRAPVHLAGFLELFLIVQRDAQQGEGSAIIGPGFHFRPEGSFGGREIAALQSRPRLPNRRSIARRETQGQSQRHGAIPEDSIHGTVTGYSTPDSRPPSMQICQTSPDAWRSDRIQVTKYPPCGDVESGFLRRRYSLKANHLLKSMDSYGRTLAPSGGMA